VEPIFLSYFLDSDTPLYGGLKGSFQICNERSIAKGDTSNNLSFTFPAHTGTHIDFPFHFSNCGKKSHDYPASFWLFKKIGFLDCTINEVESNIEFLQEDIEILILKTGFGANRNSEIYWSNQPVIPAHFATTFKKRFSKLKIFGFDLISLTSKLDREEGRKAHVNFLVNNDILVLEDMNLINLNCTPNMIIVSPLQVHSADGTPCTVIAHF